MPTVMGETSQRVWCKLVHEPELNTFKALQSLNCDAHHIATLVIEPFLLSPDQYLITMLDYGADLFLTSVHPSWARARLCGGAIHNIAVQLCEAIAFLHSHHFFHLDIKPENVAFDHTTSRLTILDLGWTMHGAFKKPGVSAAVGTHRYAPPEVCAWYVWEELDENDPTPSPSSFDPRKADVWGIGNLIGILLESDVQQVDHYEELVNFSQWLAQREPQDRPSAEEALESLRLNVFKSWVSSYFEPPPPGWDGNPDTLPSSHLKRSDRTSLDSWTDEDLRRFYNHESVMKADSPIRDPRIMQQATHNCLYNGELSRTFFPRLCTHHKQEHNGGRLIKFINLPQANHFFHSDDPAGFLVLIADIMAR
ncbi:hypothetical protein ONZ45_g9716 [Pleurotus djamor]|nr:hypothetical protein ONZ45_g9716 [Pleurotus djamor]